MARLDLCYLTAAEALQAFRSRKLSPVELMQAVIERAEAVEPMINAFTYKHYDEAMAEARLAEERYRQGKARPLEGLPVAVKDEAEIAGRPVSSGSMVMEGTIPSRTSPAIARILAAGGICHARTATPEFSIASVCWSRLWGVTRNPWNLAMTPGGSSGGSAAALAAGTAMLATGSDIGGSLRIPAACSGAVGFKPSHGRIPDEAPFNLDPYSHQGPMARSVTDAALLYNVMAGPDPRDLASIAPKLELPLRYPSIEGMRIAYSADLDMFPVHPEVVARTEDALRIMAGLGAIIDEVRLGWHPEWLQAGIDHLGVVFGAWLQREAGLEREALSSYAAAFIDFSRSLPPHAELHALEAAGAMAETLGPLLAQYDALVCPTTTIPALQADHDPTQDAVVVEGIPVEPTLGWVLTLPFNMLSRLPVLAMPSGRAANGVPTGIQIVGPPYGELEVFRLATAFEAATRPWYRGPASSPDL